MNKLLKNAWHLPWKMNDAPHGLLDILRGCNIKCKACYNNDKPRFKTIEEVKSDFYKILSLRKISAIGIIGGEPLLHPDLFEIIDFLKKQNLKIELFTNGLLLDERMCKELASAGADLIFLHVDYGQNRPDLSDNTSLEEINNLRTQKAKLIKKAGMEAAISMTLKKSQTDILLKNIDFFTESPYINYFLITLYRNIDALGKLQGELPNAISGNYVKHDTKEEITMEEVIKIISSTGAEPYCYLTGRLNKDIPRWISFVTACGLKKEKCKSKLQLKISNFEKKYLNIYKNKYKVYPFFNPQNCFINSIQIFLNGLYGYTFFSNLLFLFKNFNNIKLIKRILVQSPAEILPDNQVEHCECCPDLTVHNGKIVPVCICDNFD